MTPTPRVRTTLPARRPSVPSATYHLPLQPAFPFAAAERTVPYLAALGVSHLRLSPVLEAVPGSRRGHDVVDHWSVREELGGESALRSLARAAHAHHLGIVVDVPPDHTALTTPQRSNAPLWSVLRDGPRSPYARWFDIDWSAHHGRLLLPLLDGPLADELKELRVRGATLRYHGLVLPLRRGTEGLPLPELLDAQWYRLGWWRLANTELNYRRFLNSWELIALRVEDPVVFAACHAKLLQLTADGILDGIHVLHPDGLTDPGAYLTQWDEAVRATAGGPRWTVLEKVLTHRAKLPADWPVAGTAGYDALRHIDGLFLDPTGLADLTDTYRRVAAPADALGGEWQPTVRRAAEELVREVFPAEVERLGSLAEAIAAASLAWRDVAPWALRTALREMLVRLPIHRPYVSVAVGAPTATAADAAVLEEAAREARVVFTVLEEERAVDVVCAAALGRCGDGPVARDFRGRFAQLCAAVRTKAVEDTAFYRYTPLLSAVELGGHPGRPAVPPRDFHTFCQRLQRDWPVSGTLLSSQRTKRSADVRARLAALTERPGRWAEVLERLSHTMVRDSGVRPPDPHVAWLAWQTALGFGTGVSSDPTVGDRRPATSSTDTTDPRQPVGRLVPAVLKAAREAALRTSWAKPNAAYERAVAAFMEAGPCGPPAAGLARFRGELDDLARANSLAAALLHLTMPGVPDVHMGDETEYLALVDPDNYRPVPPPSAALGALDAGRRPEGLAAEKLWVTSRALRLRRRCPHWFGADASYRPLFARGPAEEHCLAFTRSERVVTAVTRLSGRLADAGGWRGTTLTLPDPASGHWHEMLTGRRVPRRTTLDQLFSRFPVALLLCE